MLVDPGCAMLGCYLYCRSVQLTARFLPNGIPLWIPYLAAGAVSCIAAFNYAGPVAPTLLEAAQESFGASAGLLLIRQKAGSGPLHIGKGWSAAAVLIVVAFRCTMGRGFVWP